MNTDTQFGSHGEPVYFVKKNITKPWNKLPPTDFLPRDEIRIGHAVVICPGEGGEESGVAVVVHVVGEEDAEGGLVAIVDAAGARIAQGEELGALFAGQSGKNGI